MSVFAYLVKLARLLLAAGLFATLLMGETRSAAAQDAIPAEARAHYDEADKQFRDGNLAQARNELVKTLELAPRFADAEYLLGVVYARTERYQDAIAHYSSAIAIGPERPAHYYGKGVCQRAVGDTKGSRESLNKARDMIAHDLETAKSLGEAGAQKVKTIERFLAEVDCNLAVLARDEGDDAQCKKLLDEAASRDPGSPKIAAEKGMLLLRQGDAKGAVLALQAAFDAAPENLTVLYNLGRALMAAGREEEGRKALARFKEEDEDRRSRLNEQRRKDEAEKLAQRAELEFHEGRKGPARELAQKAYVLDPANDRAKEVLRSTQ
ncbi:MAG TPA: tetratricopeptide repeat protein [Planctomycetota bacterium]|nr:tetratricopeptide repeat protein [Planctomycetota bacterium]